MTRMPRHRFSRRRASRSLGRAVSSVLAVAALVLGAAVPIAGPAFAAEPTDVEGDVDATATAAEVAEGTEATEESDALTLRWRAVDESRTIVPGTVFQLQGPRLSAAPADDDAAWSGFETAKVRDNVGEADYSGADLDPTPGVFEVAALKLGEKHTVADADHFRLRAVEADGFAVKGDAEWGVVSGAAEGTDPVSIELSRPVAEPSPTEAPASKEDDSEGDDASAPQADEAGAEEPEAEEPAAEEPATDEPGAEEPSVDDPGTDEAPLSGPTSDQPLLRAGPTVTPFAAGPDGAQPPYLYWDTRNESGNALVGGATYELQGPRKSVTGPFTGNEYAVWWNSNSVTVQDCIGPNNPSAAACAIDLDTDPGEYLVKSIGSHAVSDSNRYRLRQVTAPTTPPPGYTWVESSDWIEIPGSRNTPSGWSGSGTYDFGDRLVRSVPPQSPRCDSGYVYGLSTNGQLRQIAPGASSATNLGTPASGVSYFNALGIGPSGQPVYAIERSSGSGTSQNATVYTYDTTAGTWSSTGANTVGVNGESDTGTNMVGGAVNLKNGLYYFGGFMSNGNFKVYEYNPAGTPRIKVKGIVQTASTSSANGDIAFNANGDFFVVHGSGTTTTVYSVTAANFEAATGNTMTSSQAASRTTMNNVNGVAFDSNGRAYLGSSDIIRSYALPGWNDETAVVGSGLNSTDLASCSSPATITIEKYVDGARVNSNDQFRLNLSQGSTTLGTATASSPATGLQDQIVGPQPTVRGVQLNFTETAAGSTNLSNYATSWSCTVDGDPMPGASGTGTSGNVTIPTSGDVIVCRFVNSPLVAQVQVAKTVQDANGQNPIPGVNWTLGAAVTATAGTATPTPASATQTTGASGQVAWSVRFGNTAGRATVRVSETQKPEHVFVSGECAIVSLSGSVRTVTLTGAGGQDLTGIQPGDRVECVYVNRQTPSTLAVKKNLPDGRVQSSDQFTLSALQGSTSIGSATTAGNASGVQPQQVGPVNITANGSTSYVVRETGTNLASYGTSYRCVDLNDSGWTPLTGTLTGTSQRDVPLTNLAAPAVGQKRAIECTFTNQPSKVTIVKRTQDSTGQNEAVRQGWTVGVTGTAGNPSPNNSQQTGASGQADWKLNFTAATNTLNVTETLQPGWDFAQGALNAVCTVTPYPSGDVRTVPITSGTGATQIANVKPGDAVKCTYVNRLKPASVKIQKLVQPVGGTAAPAAGWTVGAELSGSAAGTTISTPATQVTGADGFAPNPWRIDFTQPAQNAPLPAASVAVNETLQAGYAFASGTCTITRPTTSGSETIDVPFSGDPRFVLTGGTNGVRPGDQVTCAYTNAQRAGEVNWSKVDPSGGALAGSEWKIVGPSPASTERAVTDCIAATAAGCSGEVDRNHNAGEFTVDGLQWGDYELVETQAPAGYVTDSTPHPFTISATSSKVTVGPFVNVPRNGPEIPLTGGWLSRDLFTVLGGGVLALGTTAAVLLWLRRRREVA